MDVEVRFTGTRNWLSVISASVSETRRLGSCLAGILRPGDLLLLRGPFGAGKTTFVQGLGRALGVLDPVTSPSFTLVNEYRGADRRRGPILYHIDLYRIGSADEAVDMGLEEYLANEAICAIEWPEQAEGSLPHDHLDVSIAFLGDKGRVLTLTGHGEHYVELVRQFGEKCAAMTLGESRG